MRDGPPYHTCLARKCVVHIIDEDSSTCETLAMLFGLEGFDVIVFRAAAAFLAEFDLRRPQVVALNAQLGEISGLRLMSIIKARHASPAVFLLSDDASVSLAVAAMKAGAADVIVKPIDAEYLMRSVRDALGEDMRPGARAGGLDMRGLAGLTPREREVLHLITRGQSNKEAGRALGISPRTIEVHRARVMEKLGARNTADLMRIVLMR